MAEIVDLLPSTVRAAVDDAFWEKSVQTELIETWTAREKKALMPEVDFKEDDFPAAARGVAIRLLWDLHTVLELPDESYFEAVALLDAFIVGIAGVLEVREVLTLCVALIRVVKKLDTGHTCMALAKCVPIGNQARKWFQERGHDIGEQVTARDLQHKELSILKAVKWNVNVPSISSWIQFICTRFGILTQGTLKAQIDLGWQQALIKLKVIVALQPVSLALLPRTLATGLVCIVFVSTGLVPMEAFRPEGMDSAEWTQLFVQSQIHVDKCKFPPGQASVVLQFFQVAAGLPLDQLQCAGRAVATIMSKIALRHQLGTVAGATGK